MMSPQKLLLQIELFVSQSKTFLYICFTEVVVTKHRMMFALAPARYFRHAFSFCSLGENFPNFGFSEHKDLAESAGSF